MVILALCLLVNDHLVKNEVRTNEDLARSDDAEHG